MRGNKSIKKSNLPGKEKKKENKKGKHNSVGIYKHEQGQEYNKTIEQNLFLTPLKGKMS